MHGGGGLAPGGLDPTRKPEGAKAIARDKLERGRMRGRMRSGERRIFVALAAVIALGILASVVLRATT